MEKARATIKKKRPAAVQPQIFRCSRCGKEFSSPKQKFYMSPSSPLFTANDSYTQLCNGCLHELFTEYKGQFDMKTATILICHYLDVYFSEKLYEQLKDNIDFTIGTYLQKLGLKQYKSKTFNNTILELIRNGLKGEKVIQEEIEEEWSRSDIKNRNYVIQSVGYDCFDDASYSKNNRKFLFNTLADYLTDDVLEDPHKLQCVISMVKTMFQVESVDRMLNQELKKGDVDYTMVDRLSKIKEKLLHSINTTANENGLSAKTSGKNVKGTNTLTHIMREMGENDFDEIKVNVVNAKLSESYREVAAANAKALMDELSLTSDEYAEMVAKQSETVSSLQEELEKANEEIRLLRVENKRLRTGELSKK